MIIVKICRGTVCHVMGGSNLPLIPDYISDDLKKQVRFEGTTCLGFCNKEDGMKPPFVEVNGKSISEASYASVIETIKNELKEK